MRILFACGGTGGHINPALAVAKTIQSRDPDAKILFAGNPHGMEAKLVPQAGFDFVPIKVKGFQRQINWHNIKNNLLAVAYLTTAGSRARQILKDFQPDIVMGTGRYVSGPVVMKAAKLGYKTITHEQNAFPGVTTKLLSKVVDKMLLAVEEAKRFLPEGLDCSVVGNPVREEFLLSDRNKARSCFGGRQTGCVFCPMAVTGGAAHQRGGGRPYEVALWDRENLSHPCHRLLWRGAAAQPAQGTAGWIPSNLTVWTSGNILTTWESA